MRPWEQLDEDLKHSNRDQIAYMTRILRGGGYEVLPVAGPVVLPRFNPDEIEQMAQMEHGRWNLERLRAGWQYDARRDPAHKRSPYLVTWDQLDDAAKEWDRDVVRRFPHLLAEVGLQVVRKNRPEHSTTDP